MFFQIGFCGIGELHLDAPTVDGMHAFEGFSATRTGFCHHQNILDFEPRKLTYAFLPHGGDASAIPNDEGNPLRLRDCGPCPQ